MRGTARCQQPAREGEARATDPSVGLLLLGEPMGPHDFVAGWIRRCLGLDWIGLGRVPFDLADSDGPVPGLRLQWCVCGHWFVVSRGSVVDLDCRSDYRGKSDRKKVRFGIWHVCCPFRGCTYLGGAKSNMVATR